MRIKVNQYYQGRKSNEQLIPAGIYEVGDERLFGIEDYLVNDQQKAEYIEDKVLSPAMVADKPVNLVVVERHKDYLVIEEQPVIEQTPRKRTSKKAE